jgi:S-adenosylmethionine synthetase
MDGLLHIVFYRGCFGHGAKTGSGPRRHNNVSNVLLEELKRTPLEQQRIELVERKGKGHPDSICDAIAEEVSLALCREYLEKFGRILHYNTDKAMLVAGRTQPRLGGGQVLEPMRLILGDRAVTQYEGKRLAVGEIAEVSIKKWLGKNSGSWTRRNIWFSRTN